MRSMSRKRWKASLPALDLRTARPAVAAQPMADWAYRAAALAAALLLLATAGAVL